MFGWREHLVLVTELKASEGHHLHSSNSDSRLEPLRHRRSSPILSSVLKETPFPCLVGTCDSNSKGNTALTTSCHIYCLFSFEIVCVTAFLCHEKHCLPAFAELLAK